MQFDFFGITNFSESWTCRTQTQVSHLSTFFFLHSVLHIITLHPSHQTLSPLFPSSSSFHIYISHQLCFSYTASIMLSFHHFYKQKGLSFFQVEKINFTNHKGFFLLLEGVGGFCCFSYIGKEREEPATDTYIDTYKQKHWWRKSVIT